MGQEMEVTKISLREILNNSASMPWRTALFVDKEKPLELSSEVILHDPDDISDDDSDIPEAVLAAGFEYLIDTPAVQDICENARAQIENASIDKFFEALNFYLKNDAFIEFS